MIFCRESPKGSTKKLLTPLEMISAKFWNTRSIYKSQLYLYIPTSNEQSEMKLNNFIYDSIKTATYLRMNLTKEMEDVFYGNYKTSLKQSQENINN